MSDPGWDNCGVSGPRLRPITNMVTGHTRRWSGDTRTVGTRRVGDPDCSLHCEMLSPSNNQFLEVCYILCQSQSFPKLL